MKQLLDQARDDHETTSTSKRGTYQTFTADEKARIEKRDAENGVIATVRYFSKVFPGRSLKENSVRTWRTKYLQEIAARRAEEESSVKELASKKTGRPLLLGVDLDRQVRAYLEALRENGAVVNTAFTVACARGVVKNFDSNLLECNEGNTFD